MGFQEQLYEILRKLPTENRQTLLFSATMPQSIVDFAKIGLQNPILIRLDAETKLNENLTLAFFQCKNEDKIPFLLYLINMISKKQGIPLEAENNTLDHCLAQTLIFAPTKHHVEFLKVILEENGCIVSYIHSGIDQAARKINLAKFYNKKSTILIVTDIAARGKLAAAYFLTPILFYWCPNLSKY